MATRLIRRCAVPIDPPRRATRAIRIPANSATGHPGAALGGLLRSWIPAFSALLPSRSTALEPLVGLCYKSRPLLVFSSDFLFFREWCDAQLGHSRRGVLRSGSPRDRRPPPTMGSFRTSLMPTPMMSMCAAGRERTIIRPRSSTVAKKSKSIGTIRVAGTPSARRATASVGFPPGSCNRPTIIWPWSSAIASSVASAAASAMSAR